MVVTWIQCTNGWCSFSELDLQHPNLADVEGVYILWYTRDSSRPAPVYVGQGVIADRLGEHRRNLHFAGYTLFVTWAAIGPALKDGVESYLIRHLRPPNNQLVPTADPITVNLPWALYGTSIIPFKPLTCVHLSVVTDSRPGGGLPRGGSSRHCGSYPYADGLFSIVPHHRAPSWEHPCGDSARNQRTPLSRRSLRQHHVLGLQHQPSL